MPIDDALRVGIVRSQWNCCIKHERVCAPRRSLHSILFHCPLLFYILFTLLYSSLLYFSVRYSSLPFSTLLSRLFPILLSALLQFSLQPYSSLFTLNSESHLERNHLEDTAGDRMPFSHLLFDNTRFQCVLWLSDVHLFQETKGFMTSCFAHRSSMFPFRVTFLLIQTNRSPHLRRPCCFSCMSDLLCVLACPFDVASLFGHSFREFEL